MRIEKRVWPEYFEKLATGEKAFEVRLADQEYNPGDVMALREWDPGKKAYTGRVLEKRVSYSLKTKDLENKGFWAKNDIEQKGFVIIGLK